jgi:hypothetical protein
MTWQLISPLCANSSYNRKSEFRYASRHLEIDLGKCIGGLPFTTVPHDWTTVSGARSVVA